jgi:hypothetical protein
MSHEISRRNFLKLTAMSPLALTLRWRDLLGLVSDGPEVNRLSTDVLDFQTQQAIAIKAASLIRLTSDGADAEASDLKGQKYSSADNICGSVSIYPLLGTVIEG